MKKVLAAVILLILVLFFSILVYKSPDETHIVRNLSCAIEQGCTFACYLLNGYKQGLLKMADECPKILIMENESAKEKIERSTFQQAPPLLEMYDLVKKKWPDYGKNIIFDKISPLLEEQQKEKMKLIALEKMDNFVVMTFAYTDYLDRVVEILGKGKMFFTVALRYWCPYDDRLIPKLVRKIANLPILCLFIGYMGTKGRWVVIDYNYKYNLNDYFHWLLKEGENWRLQEPIKRKKSLAEFLATPDKFEEKIAKELHFLYTWADITAKNQFERIEWLGDYKRKEWYAKEKNGNGR